jgi:site-specific recombinase
MIDQLSIEKRLHQLRELGKVAAKAKSDMVKLEEGKRSTLAILMKKYAAQGIDAANAQEREARADPEMLALIQTWGDAVEIYESARWELEVAKLGVSLIQTAAANERIERKGYGA